MILLLYEYDKINFEQKKKSLLTYLLNLLIDVSGDHGLFLSEGTYIEFVVKESYIRNQLFQAFLDEKHGAIQGLVSFEIKMRTIKKDSVLIFCQSKAVHLELKVSNLP